MIGYVLLIALLNLGLGFALAAYLGRSRSLHVGENPAVAQPEPTARSSPLDAEAARAALKAQLSSHKGSPDAEAELPSGATDNAVAEPAVAAAGDPE